MGEVRSRQLQAALTAFAEESCAHLRACVHSGEEVPFELDSRSGRGRGASPLYCYLPLTHRFIAEHFQALVRLPSHANAVASLSQFDGLDRYLLARDCEVTRADARTRSNAALLAFLEDLFEEQTDFELHPQRLHRALARVEGSALANPAEVTVLGTLHGLAIGSEELPLTAELLLARPHALEGVPEQALGACHELSLPDGVEALPDGVEAFPDGGKAPRDPTRDDAQPLHAAAGEPLLVAFRTEHPDPRAAIARGREALRELLCGLRLFGDGRIALGSVAYARIADGPWSTLAMGPGGHPHGMLLVTPEQEDELRAFCNLLARRTPREGEVAWALRRFELGCERSSEYEGLSDHLLALRALLSGPREAEPAGTSNGLLAARLSALCAIPEHRTAVTERTLAAMALERAAISGTAVQHTGGLEVARELSNHLRALLRDLICGHLPSDLVGLADELLLSGAELGEEPADELGSEAGVAPHDVAPHDLPTAHEVLGDAGEPSEILHLSV